MSIFEHHIAVSSDQESVITLLNNACVADEIELSKNQIKSAIQKGALWLTRDNKTQRLRKVKKTLLPNDTLHFYYNEKVLDQQPQPAQLIADQKHYSVWYKPYGMLSQGSKWSDHCTINRWVETELMPQRPAFVVHRLDRAASGLIVIAHSKKANQAFAQLFTKRQLDKRYHIICHGNLEQTSAQQGIIVTKAIDGKSAESTFYPITYHQAADISLIEVKIATGRKHQIRKHAASLAVPVVGDRLHGDPLKIAADIDLQLCAVSLSFTCPFTSQQQCFALPEALRPNLTSVAEKILLQSQN